MRTDGAAPTAARPGTRVATSSADMMGGLGWWGRAVRFTGSLVAAAVLYVALTGTARAQEDDAQRVERLRRDRSFGGNAGRAREGFGHGAFLRGAGAPLVADMRSGRDRDAGGPVGLSRTSIRAPGAACLPTQPACIAHCVTVTLGDRWA